MNFVPVLTNRFARFARFEVFWNFSVHFHERFRTLRIVGKCTGRHLFRYVGLRAMLAAKILSDG